MLALSQTTGYAVLALACLSDQEDQWVQTLEIAQRSGVPRPYLSKILHALGQSGLVRTKRGYRGGFALSAPPDRINLLDVAEAVEGKRWAPTCILGLAHCSDARACPMHEFWKRERQRIANKLRRVTLAEMAEFEVKSRAARRATKSRSEKARDTKGRRS